TGTFGGAHLPLAGPGSRTLHAARRGQRCRRRPADRSRSGGDPHGDGDVRRRRGQRQGLTTVLDAVRLSLTWMTVLPLGRTGIPGAGAAGRAMTALPVVGFVCGLLATAAAVAVVVALTRGMHVDALADTADALGSYAGPERAREIMRSGSVGPMGTATLVLVLLAEVAALGALVEAGAWLAPVAALVLSR